ncbi:MAG: transcription antitermination factor NusB [Verrucomicrobia bacterium]|nr:transcription antitermination factor NusB [Verrucomicrobiota bacterium]
MRLSESPARESYLLSDKTKKPGTRREAREAAIQFLFSHDLNDETLPGQCADFWELRKARKKVQDFANDLISGIFAQGEGLDNAIDAASENYTLDRLSPIDRNILRLATFEILHRDDIPAAVTINEAIEIAKRFGTAESPGFINGVLDGIQRDQKKKAN